MNLFARRSKDRPNYNGPYQGTGHPAASVTTGFSHQLPRPGLGLPAMLTFETISSGALRAFGFRGA